MSLCLDDGNGEGKLEFSWGRKRVIGSIEDHTYYESFAYDGMEYFLYDSVYLCRAGELEPYIGKLVNMWETASHEKNVKIVWFLRPGEIQWHLRGLKPQSNEIFLASGKGLGLCNDNCLEAISGKCNVICTSKDKRNPVASEEELKSADFIFHRTFNVESCKISEKFPDVIAGHKVERFFNQRRDQKVIHHPKPVGILSKKPGIASPSIPETDTTLGRVKEERSRRSSEANDLPMKKRKLEGISGYFNVKPDKALQSIVNNSKCIPEPQVEELIRRPSLVKEERSRRSTESDIHRMKKMKLEGISGDSNVKPDKAHSIVEKPMGITEPQAEALTRRPSVDSSTWFKQQPWEERLRKAHVDGSLVLLENLDPSYSSSEVESCQILAHWLRCCRVTCSSPESSLLHLCREVVRQAFNKKVSAKMIPHNTFSSPHYGQALVIFKSKNDADFAVSELNKKCLVLGDRRPVIGRKAPIRESGSSSRFVGHLAIEKLRFQNQHADMRDAVSTSHCAQPNTIEYEMAMEWRVLQEKANIWWHALHKKHFKAIADLGKDLYYKQPSMHAEKKGKPNY